jgi:tetratricopeptide (TPR) repeat protein
VALALTTRASVLASRHDHRGALPFAEEAVKIMEEAPEGQSITMQVAVFNLGLLYKRLGRYPEAARRIEQALALGEKSGGPNAQTPDYLNGLAETYQQLGKLEAALEAATKGIFLREKAAGPNAPSLAAMLSVRGGIYVDLKRQADAAVDLKRALDLMQGPDGNPDLREVTRYDLARSLWYAKATRPQAVQMVGEVRTFFAKKGPNYADYVAEADSWLKTHLK